MDLPYYEDEDDFPHVAPDRPDWQESALFAWHDANAGVGGFLRLGHEPANEAANICLGVFGPDGRRYRWNESGVRLQPGDRQSDSMGLTEALKVRLGQTSHIEVNLRDCEARLTFRDFHPRYDYAALVNAPGIYGKAIGKEHFEVSGAITGNIRIGDRTFAIDGLGYRDRSWGTRVWGVARGTRWWPTVIGPDLSLHMIHKMTDSGGLVKHGYAIRNGAPEPIVDAEIVVHLESDALSYRAATGRVRLAGGDELRLNWRLEDAMVLHVRGFTAVEATGRVSVDGREGFSHLEVCTNPALGKAAPMASIFANLADGFTQGNLPAPAR